MNKKQQEEFIELVKRGTLEALKSNEGKQAVVSILKTNEAKEVFIDNFVESFHEVIVPVLEQQDKRIKKLEERKIAI